eukprot:CAMPEP_0178990534 /NCGR_PEP_ID=MMETSP0795-20121207/5009_1 /TAXON_ID=88552 /ORGANISM="Amoebophrya sp., Strain Ameob2" /LENGTH=179 /DNA_ID=CAMNT_0020682109 /DNA_START=283 /DNA_END=823 /DNA_ORIENTATION=-
MFSSSSASLDESIFRLNIPPQGGAAAGEAEVPGCGGAEGRVLQGDQDQACPVEGHHPGDRGSEPDGGSEPDRPGREQDQVRADGREEAGREERKTPNLLARLRANDSGKFLEESQPAAEGTKTKMGDDFSSRLSQEKTLRDEELTNKDIRNARDLTMRQLLRIDNRPSGDPLEKYKPGG